MRLRDKCFLFFCIRIFLRVSLVLLVPSETEGSEVEGFALKFGALYSFPSPQLTTFNF